MSDPLGEWRADIDDFDAQIIELVAQRQAVSKRIQEWRMANGGGPIDRTREEQVLVSYEAQLGIGGRELAAAVLDCCRPAPD